MVYYFTEKNSLKKLVPHGFFELFMPSRKGEAATTTNLTRRDFIAPLTNQVPEVA